MNFLSLFSSVVLIILASTPLQKPLYAQSTKYETCSQTSYCGNTKISYPFYGGKRPDYCGYPGFNLSCNGMPQIAIMSQLYYVLGIDTTTAGTLTVARQDYWNNKCPTSLLNVSIDFTLFSYASTDANITLRYGCSSVLSTAAIEANCNSNVFGSIAYYVTSSMAEKLNIQALCSSYLFVPVFQSAADDIDSNPQLASVITALADGFELEWTANNSYCDECVGFGGLCGYDWDKKESTCYCANQTNCYTSASGSGSSNKTGLAIGISVGVVGVLLLGCSSFLILRKRKRVIVSNVESKDSATPFSLVLPSSSGLTSSNDLTPSSGSTTATETMTTVNHSLSIPSYISSKPDPERGSTYFGVQVFTYTELEEATGNFNESRQLGDGGFGTVYYGELPDGRRVAVKRLYEKNFRRVEQFMNEVEILARLRHKNLVTLYGCTSKQSRELLLVYEYIPNGTVADHLHGKLSESGLLTWPLRLSIAVETAEALAYLHSSDVIHRDVKTTNILLDKNFKVKVADFGLSRLFPNDATHISTAPQGTPGYVDPEYFQLFRLTERSDVYSFGVVLIELISSMQAIDADRQGLDANLATMALDRIQKQALNELVDPCLGFEENDAVRDMIKLVAELAFQCLQKERDLRPSMLEVLLILKGIQKRMSSSQKQVLIDVKDNDEVVLLKNVVPQSPLQEAART